MGQKKCKQCNGIGYEIIDKDSKRQMISDEERYSKRICINCKGKGRVSSGKKRGKW